MKKTEQITVHLDSTDKEYCIARAGILDVSASEYVANLIAKDRMKTESEFHRMAKIFGMPQNDENC